jgi:hypothetical protein
MNGMARLPGYLRAGLRLVVLLGVTAMMAAPSFEAAAGVDLPKLEKGKGDKCVEDTAFMRRNHMDLLKHHRNETMRQGIRTTKHSLKGCVECHASSKTGSVASAKGDFCVACHSYAGAKPDCWDCHATKPGKRSIQQTAQPAASPLMPSSGGAQ